MSLAEAPAAPSQPAFAPPKIANVPGRLGPTWLNRLRAVGERPWKRRLAKAALLIPQIRKYEETFLRLPEAEFRTVAMRLRGKSRASKSLDLLIPEAFGLACAAVRRVHGFQPFDVQLAAGVILHYGGLVELATGEGKTLCAVCPTFLNALPGKGVHVTTVNDYLARRDADDMGPVYQMLGLTVGCLAQKMDDASRVAAYKCDITYGTASEFGFDFLRDRMKVRGGQSGRAPVWAPWFGGTQADGRVQRELNFAIVDEADSIFVDEARTPLIIANPTRPATDDEKIVYVWADRLVRTMTPDLFAYDPKKDRLKLNDAGKQAVRYSNPPTGEHAQAMDKLHDSVEQALQAHYRFQRDQQYMVNGENKIVIIDESTGRPMPDRHWRDGLHQAVEVKENVEVTMQSDHAAQVTYQNFYRLYKKLAGMSGTLLPNFWEMRKVYKRWVTRVPTNRPVMRRQLPDGVYPSEHAKFQAAVGQIAAMLAQGRPVLVGTRTVDKSEALAAMLTSAGIPHEVLNARQDARENEVISQAGQRGRVTVATNMAGRGTDIKLGLGVAECGGLHVLGTERHEAERVDRQLAGRAGRQGDPGSAQFLLCLEDQLLEGLGTARRKKLLALGKSGATRPWVMFRRLFLRSQRTLERKHRKQRLDLMNYDRQRQEMLQDLGADPYVD